MSYKSVGQPFGFGQEDRVSMCCEPTCEEPCVMTTGSNCGSVYGTQFMLFVLDFYRGELNGKSTPETQAAITAYAASRGIVVNPANPSGKFCASLMADYDAHIAQPQLQAGAGCPPGQVGAPPFCFGPGSTLPGAVAPPPPPPAPRQPSIPPPSVPPAEPSPQEPPPAAPLKAETIFGLPPVAVYLGLGALGLVTIAAIAKKTA